MHRLPFSTLAILLVCIALAACSDDGGGDTPDDDGRVADTQMTADTATSSGGDVAADADADADVAPQPLPGPPAPGEWAQMSPGGETICSRGTPYHFFVRGGDPNKVIIDFQGGGACWDEFTCSVAGSIFSAEVGPLEDFVGALDAGVLGGIYNHEMFSDWTLVHIPYCTGDIHWGNSVKSYNDNLTIQHKGFVNASAVLDWVYEHHTAPEEVFVTGCSAGSYGAIFHSAYVAEQYPDATLRVFGDSGLGIITDTFFEDSFPSWDAIPNFPPQVTRIQADVTTLTLADFYIGVAETYPQHRFSHYSSRFDSDQIFYYTVMGGEAVDWPDLMTTRLRAMRAGAENFRYYMAPGPIHCVIPYPFFDDRTSGGGAARLVDWLDAFLHSDALPDDVECEGDECFDEPLCDACAAGSDEPFCRFCVGWPDNFQQP